MILATLADADRYAALHPLLGRVFEFMRNTDLHKLEPGRHPIEGENLFAIVEKAQGRSREKARLECHRKYIDLQLVLEGQDEMGWRALSGCADPMSDYSEERDIQFFQDSPATWIPVPPGSFCLFFPEDAHAPLVSHGLIRKVIFKIAARP